MIVAVTTSGRAAGAGIDDDRIGASADRVVDRDEAGLRVDRAGHGLAVDPAIATGRRQREGAMGVVERHLELLQHAGRQHHLDRAGANRWTKSGTPMPRWQTGASHGC